METQQISLIVIIVVLAALMFVPQWQARRRRQKQMDALQIGNEVMTIGGIIGRLTHLSSEENRARIEIAPGVELTVTLTAIRGPVSQM